MNFTAVKTTIEKQCGVRLRNSRLGDGGALSASARSHGGGQQQGKTVVIELWRRDSGLVGLALSANHPALLNLQRRALAAIRCCAMAGAWANRSRVAVSSASCCAALARAWA